DLSVDVAGDGAVALEVVLRVVVGPDADRVGVRIDRNCRNRRLREQQNPRRPVASIRDLVCPFRTRRIAGEVATVQLAIAVGGAQRATVRWTKSSHSWTYS